MSEDQRRSQLGKFDKLQEECGVMGVFGDLEAANLIYLGLYALQHRGQEACGIITIEQTEQDQHLLHGHKAFGLVNDSVTREILDNLKGQIGVGHVRYSTQGGRLLQNIQPFVFRTKKHGQIAIAHNGSLTNAKQIREELEDSGAIFTSTSDTEVFLHLLARSKKELLADRIAEVMEEVKGAYSLVIATKNELYAVRDPFGFRPLVYGKRGDAFVVASETCALDLLDVEASTEVEPGEIVRITEEGISSSFPHVSERKAFCSFEPIYFSRPDSDVFGENVYSLRKQMGAELAKEGPAEADIVCAIPDSGVPMAIGFSEASGIPLELGLIRNHYVGRTFIEPSQAIRDFGVKLKLNPVGSLVKGKRVVLVDDSIVRGTTCKKMVRMLRNAGASEVHFRVGSPPITHSCFYGVDTPDRYALLAATKNINEIREFIGADSIAYLSQEGLARAIKENSSCPRYCTACFNGKYLEEVYTTIPSQPTDGEGPGYQANK